jgi:putative phage-type endonuclease
MIRTRLIFNSREEWLAARNEGIGASEVASVLGLNPWETPYQLWRKKRGIDKPQEENFFMKAGHYLEDAVARFYADESGREIIKSSATDFMFIDKDKPFLRVSPDRTFWLPDVARNDDNKGILECKTTQRPVDPDDLPKHWFCQVQMNLGVAGYEQGSLAWLCSGREFGYKDITFAPDFYGWMIEEVERFWVDNVLGGKEPAAINVQDILTKYNRHTDGKQIEVSDEIFETYKDLKDLKKEISALEDRKETLENRIKMAFADAEAITYGGDTLATWKAPKPTEKINTKLLEERYPNIAKEITQSVQGSRRFLLK